MNKAIFKTIALVLTLVLTGIYFMKQGAKTTERAPQPISWVELKRDLDQYYTLHKQLQQDKYFLSYAHMQEEARMGDAVKKFRGRLLKIKSQYADLSSLTKEVNAYFQNFSMEVFWEAQGHSHPLFDNPAEGKGVQRIGLVPQEMVNHPAVKQANFIYKPYIKGITVMAIDWSDVSLASRFYHELGHAYRHQACRDGADHADDAHIIAEEVEMHLLTGAILNRGTNGIYTQHLDKVIDRVQRSTDFRAWRDAVFSQVRINDLSQVDRINGTEAAGYIEIKSQVAEFFTQLGFRMISRSGTNESLNAQIEHYKWVFHSLAQKLGYQPSSNEKK